jgi:signal transduction histidine kinase
LAYQWLNDMGHGEMACWVEAETDSPAPAWIIRFSETEPIGLSPGDTCRLLPPALLERVAFVRPLAAGSDIQITTSPHAQILLQCPLLTSSVQTLRDLTRMAAEVSLDSPHEMLAEMRYLHRELIDVLQEFGTQQAELKQLSGELDDTNRGVMALYTELEARAEHLQRIEEAKSRFFSQMSHEFRVPINAVLSLCRLLLDQVDGPLTEEQTKQVTFIRTEGENLAKLVNDLLDLARSEAGRMTFSVGTFEVSSLFNSLRNILKPLLQDAVELIFEQPDDLPSLETDEEKVTQILRNLISNALKYTSQGEVHVSASLSPDGETVTFAVRDTGIGIKREDQAVIFEAFTQIEHGLQKRVKGSGLGLALSQKLAELLQGELTVESQPGQGSTFRLSLPRRYHPSVSPSERVDQMMTRRLNVSRSLRHHENFKCR